MGYQISIDRDVMVEMRDGVSLCCDIYRPSQNGRFPVLLARTPYNKGLTQKPWFPLLYSPFHYLNPVRAASNAYIVIIQDVRGRWGSEGIFYPFLHESEDGYDTIEWASRLPYSDGKVGMFGGSYLGATQWLAAITRHPALEALVPLQTGSQYYEGWTYQGGAFRLDHSLLWALNLSLETVTRLPKSQQAKARRIVEDGLSDISNGYRYRPLAKYPSLRRTAPYFYHWLEHQSRDEYWERWNIENHYAEIDCATLNIGGWYDPFARSVIKNFTSMRRIHGAKKHKLVIGPWAHFPPYVVKVGDMDFGANAYIDLDDLQLRWFDRWLKGLPTKDDDRPVDIFMMGENRWTNEKEWPPADTTFTLFYLHSKGDAQLSGSLLSTTKPSEEPADSYFYDPANPVPSHGGATLDGLSYAGPRDQRPLHTRPDVLFYETAPLEEPTVMMGPIGLNLWASSTARDTDFTARVLDIHPDGYAQDLTDGILRTRFRNSSKNYTLLAPGRPYLFKIDLGATCNTFMGGHRIALQVSSSNFPAFDVNLNKGEASGEAVEMHTAVQTIYHDATRPSTLVLPIRPKNKS